MQRPFTNNARILQVFFVKCWVVECWIYYDNCRIQMNTRIKHRSIIQAFQHNNKRQEIHTETFEKSKYNIAEDGRRKTTNFNGSYTESNFCAIIKNFTRKPGLDMYHFFRFVGQLEVFYLSYFLNVD